MGNIPPVPLLMTTSACYLCCVFPPLTGFATGVCVFVSDGDTVSQATSQTDGSHNDAEARWKHAATRFHSRQI